MKCQIIFYEKKNCLVQIQLMTNWQHFEGWAQDWRKSDGCFSPNLISLHDEGVMKITTFLSVNNENLGAIARMSNGT